MEFPRNFIQYYILFSQWSFNHFESLHLGFLYFSYFLKVGEQFEAKQHANTNTCFALWFSLSSCNCDQILYFRIREIWVLDVLDLCVGRPAGWMPGRKKGWDFSLRRIQIFFIKKTRLLNIFAKTFLHFFEVSQSLSDQFLCGRKNGL